MSQNLDATHFRNGDEIPQATNALDWRWANMNKEPAWCYYKFNESNGEKYQKMYNWYAVNDPRGLAPEGWHIPSMEEFDILVDHLGGEIEGGEKLKSTTGWKSFGKWASPGTNESGFNGTPNGIAEGDGTFQSKGKYGHWWSSTLDEVTEWDIKHNQPQRAYLFILKYHNGGCGEGSAHRGSFFLDDGMGVRCVKD